MNESLITLAGWLGGDVHYLDKGEVKVAHLRVGTTPRRFDKDKGEWVDADTQWYAVTAWRQLAENCSRSLKRGDPVVVHGRVKAQQWINGAGVQITGFEVEASFVGHDLNRGTSQFTRAAAPAREDQSVRVNPRTGEILDPVAEAPAA